MEKIKAYLMQFKEWVKDHPYGAFGVFVAFVAAVYYMVTSSSGTDATITPQDETQDYGGTVPGAEGSGLTYDDSILSQLQDQLANAVATNDYLRQAMLQQQIDSMAAMEQPSMFSQMAGMAVQNELYKAVNNGITNLFGGGSAAVTTLNPVAATASNWSVAHEGLAPTFENGGLQAIENQVRGQLASTASVPYYDPGSYATSLSAGTSGTYNVVALNSSATVGNVTATAANNWGVTLTGTPGASAGAASTTQVGVGSTAGGAAQSTATGGAVPGGASIGVDLLGIGLWDAFGRQKGTVTGHSNTANAGLAWLVSGNPVIGVAGALVNKIGKGLKRLWKKWF